MLTVLSMRACVRALAVGTYHVVSHHAVLYYTKPHHAGSHHAVSHHAVLNHTVLYQAGALLYFCFVVQHFDVSGGFRGYDVLSSIR